MNKVLKVQPDILDFPQRLPPSARRAGLDPARYEVLLSQLPSATDALSRCRACEIPESDLSGYVALGWLRWNGGRLDVTELGQDLTRRMTAMQADVVETKATVESPPIRDHTTSDVAVAVAVAEATSMPRTKGRSGVADFIKAREKHRLALAKRASRAHALDLAEVEAASGLAGRGLRRT